MHSAQLSVRSAQLVMPHFKQEGSRKRGPFLMLALLVAIAFVSCNGDKTIPHFELKIEKHTDSTTIVYTLTDTSLLVQEISPTARFTLAPLSRVQMGKHKDTLFAIARLDAKAHDCTLQHALNADEVTFTNDSGTVEVYPDINHAKELDIVVRFLNSVLPEKYHLHFIDMQSAIEPNGKQEL